MPDPFVIHRDGLVSDRETGESLGQVDPVDAFPEYWFARPPGHVGRALGGYGNQKDAARLLWERWRERRCAR